MTTSRTRAVQVPWDSQPPENTPLNKEDPITKGLIGFLWMSGSQPKDLISGQYAKVTNAPPTPCKNGIARVAPSVSGNGVYYDRQANTGWFTTGPLSFMVFENHTTANSTGPFAAAGHGTSGYHIDDQYGGTRTRRVGITTSSGTTTASDAAAWNSNETIRGLTWDGATLSGYEGDKVFATAAWTGTVTYDSFARVFWSSNPDGVANVGGTGYWMAAWDRVLTQAEIERLNDTPWCMFEPHQYLTPSAASYGRRVYSASVPWDSQPQELARIATDNGITAGLAMLTGLGSGAYDALTGSISTVEAGAALSPTQYGKSLSCGAGPAGIKPANVTDMNSFCSASTLTVMMLVRINSLGNRRIFLADYNAAGTAASISFEQTAGNQWWLQLVNTTPAVIFHVPAGTVTVGWHWIEVTFTQGARADSYIDGVLLTSDTSSAILAARRAGTDYRIGRPGAYTLLPFDGDVAFHAVWNRVLSDAERESVRRLPWQLFQDRLLIVHRKPATSYGSGLHLEYGEIKYTVTLTSGHMKISVTPAGTLQASLTVVAPNKQLTLVSGIVST